MAREKLAKERSIDKIFSPSTNSSAHPSTCECFASFSALIPGSILCCSCACVDVRFLGSTCCAGWRGELTVGRRGMWLAHLPGGGGCRPVGV